MTRIQRQIEVDRKGDACVVVRDETGRAQPGVPVALEQESHEFRFGCVVSNRARYQARLEEVFNHIGELDALRVELPDRVPLGQLWRRLDQLGAGDQPLHVHVWGSTVGMKALPADREPSDSVEREIGHRVAELYTLCFAHPSVHGVFWHGFADGDEDARGGGLLRRDCSPKYAYRALQKLIDVVWHSRAAGETDRDGRFPFRGFFGDYRVVVGVGGENPTVTRIPVRREAGGPFSVVEIATGQRSL